MGRDKDQLRNEAWNRLEETGSARFPFPVTGRIPNFAGAKAAAERLFAHAVWEGAGTLKTNPDYAQFPVRVSALAAGKDVYMAVPRLARERCFLHLDPARIDDPEKAATISGAATYGTPVMPEAVPTIDLIVIGSVAVTESGTRIGKGEGYSDLEYAILRECDRVTPETPVVTTVHEHQVVDSAREPELHDVPLDWIFTPERTIEVTAARDPPHGIDWSLLGAAEREEIPILQTLEPDD